MNGGTFRIGLMSLVVAIVVFVVLTLVTIPLLAFVLVFAVLLGAFYMVTRPADTVLQGPRTPEPRPGFGRALLSQLPTPLVVISDRGRITYANAESRKLGVQVRTGDHFATTFRATVFIETVNGVLQTGETASCQFSLPGQDKVLEARVSPLPDGVGLGDTPQVIAVIQDRTEEIRAAEMRTDFIANASHELRTPLASVLGYIETLQGHAKDDPDAQVRFLDIMARQAGRMNRLVEDLLSLSRIEMDARRKPTDMCDLNQVVREAAAALKPVAEKYDSELQVDLPETAAMVLGDRDQLVQVASNLIDNALKYGRGELVTVTGSRDETRQAYVITVADHGPGIAREHLPRLTERFYRVNVSESRSIGGTGLGLAIVKHILNRHDGGMDVASEPGQGSRFSIWIPAQNTAASVAEDSRE